MGERGREEQPHHGLCSEDQGAGGLRVLALLPYGRLPSQCPVTKGVTLGMSWALTTLRAVPELWNSATEKLLAKPLGPALGWRSRASTYVASLAWPCPWKPFSDLATRLPSSGPSSKDLTRHRGIPQKPWVRLTERDKSRSRGMGGGQVLGAKEDKPTTTPMSTLSGPALCQDLAGLVFLCSHNSLPIGSPVTAYR